MMTRLVSLHAPRAEAIGRTPCLIDEDCQACPCSSYDRTGLEKYARLFSPAWERERTASFEC
jgi:hypothetical protein